MRKGKRKGKGTTKPRTERSREHGCPMTIRQEHLEFSDSIGGPGDNCNDWPLEIHRAESDGNAEVWDGNAEVREEPRRRRGPGRSP